MLATAQMAPDQDRIGLLVTMLCCMAPLRQRDSTYPGEHTDSIREDTGD